jgi:2-dehydro-3-deoxyphosphogluconate aldolase/(4S)-4-hydroxy-2-oxoglutarate aldolase
VAEAGAVAFGGGGNLTAGAETGDYESISELARELVGRVKEVREK